MKERRKYFHSLVLLLGYILKYIRIHQHEIFSQLTEEYPKEKIRVNENNNEKNQFYANYYISLSLKKI